MASDKKQGCGIKFILAFISAFVVVYIGVNLMNPIQDTINTASNITSPATPIPAQELLYQLSNNVHSPTWIIIVGMIQLVCLGVAWYIGHKHKFAILGDVSEES